jgi:hypothetical protein
LKRSFQSGCRKKLNLTLFPPFDPPTLRWKPDRLTLYTFFFFFFSFCFLVFGRHNFSPIGHYYFLCINYGGITHSGSAEVRKPAPNRRGKGRGPAAGGGRGAALDNIRDARGNLPGGVRLIDFL